MQAMHMAPKATVVISADLTTSCRLYVPLKSAVLIAVDYIE